MTRLMIDLPEKLAEEARNAGLLTTDAIEAMLREQLRTRRVDELFEAMDRMAAIQAPAVMSPEEIAEEMRAIRAERNKKKHG